MTEHDKMVVEVSIKLEAIKAVTNMLDNAIETNPVGGAMTALETIVDSIEEILNSKEGEP